MSVLQLCFLDASSQSIFLLLPSAVHFSSSEEDNKDNEEDDKDEKDLDHQPAIGGDWLEIFQDLCVGGLHIELGVFNVSIDPVGGWEEV